MQATPGDLFTPIEESNRIKAFKNLIRHMWTHRGQFDDILPKILSRIAAFVAESPPRIYQRFLDLGVLRIDYDSEIPRRPSIWVLNANRVRPLLHISKGGQQTEISKSYFNIMLNDCGWETIKRSNVDLGRHQAFFRGLSFVATRDFSLRVIPEIEPISVLLRPLVTDRHPNHIDLRAKLASAKAQLRRMRAKIGHFRA
jgi:hypothetical protein